MVMGCVETDSYWTIDENDDEDEEEDAALCCMPILETIGLSVVMEGRGNDGSMMLFIMIHI